MQQGMAQLRCTNNIYTTYKQHIHNIQTTYAQRYFVYCGLAVRTASALPWYHRSMALSHTPCDVSGKSQGQTGFHTQRLVERTPKDKEA